MAAVKLSPGEEQLIASIIEYIYPEPKEGSVMPLEHDVVHVSPLRLKP